MTIKFRAKHKSGFWVDGPLTPFTFPGGEAHIKQAEGSDLKDYTQFVADIRGQTPQDLFHFLMWEDLLYREGAEGVNTTLFLPYIPAARADRGAPFGLYVYAAPILSTEVTKIVTLDPHSDVAARTYGNRLVSYPTERIIRKEVQDASRDSKPNNIYQGVIAPDKGSKARAEAAATVMGVPVYFAGKNRDEATGRLSNFHMEDELPAEGKFLLVDDICDGGGTFNGLADAIGIGKDRLDLWVTHGIFSKGFRELRKNFGLIHTTDSYYHVLDSGQYAGRFGVFNDDPDFVKVHKITPYLCQEVQGG